MLPEKDKRDYKKSILEVMTEIGRPVLCYPTIKPTPLNDDFDIYGEEEHLVGEPLELIAEVSVQEPSVDSINPIQTVGIMIYNIVVPQLLFEELNIDPFMLIDSYFEFDNTKYKVLDVKPEGAFSDFYTSYKFKTEKV